MLENFTDEEIAEELLGTGELFPKDFLDDRIIENDCRYNRAGQVVGTVVKYIATYKGSGERHTEHYRNLKELLFCEYLTFDDLRRDWRYYGVLLGSPQFCEKLVHDSACPCDKCRKELAANQ